MSTVTLFVCSVPECGASLRDDSATPTLIADRAGWRLVPEPGTGIAVWACPEHTGIPRRVRRQRPARVRPRRGPEVVESWVDRAVAGQTMAQIAATEGITQQAVSARLRRHPRWPEVAAARVARREARAAEVVARQAAVVVARKTTITEAPSWFREERWYSDEQILADLRGWVTSRIEAGDYGYRGQDWPGPPTLAVIIARFGSWRAAVARAMGWPDPLPRVRRSDRVSEQDILEGVSDFLADPTQTGGGSDSYDRWARTHGRVSISTVRNRFGTWTHAKRLALEMLGLAK